MSKKTYRTPPNKRWNDLEVLKMRWAILRGQETLQSIANREGVSRQRISQLVGRLHPKK